MQWAMISKVLILQRGGGIGDPGYLVHQSARLHGDRALRLKSFH
jgi:hypothetical protein